MAVTIGGGERGGGGPDPLLDPPRSDSCGRWSPFNILEIFKKSFVPGSKNFVPKLQKSFLPGVE